MIRTLVRPRSHRGIYGGAAAQAGRFRDMAGTYNRRTLQFLLSDVMAEGRLVDQGASSVELLLELLYATHNLPRILVDMSDTDDTFDWMGGRIDVDTWLRTKLLGPRFSDQLRVWVTNRLDGYVPHQEGPLVGQSDVPEL
jgi:hypothetical protein